MRTCSAFFILFFMCSALSANKLTEPKSKAAIKTKSKRGVRSVQQIIQAQIPDFRQIPQTAFNKEILGATAGSPTRVVGDFNGDRKKDIALYGYSKAKNTTYILAVVSTSKMPRVVILEEALSAEVLKFSNWSTYISLGVKQKYNGTKQDLLQIETQDSPIFSVELYYYSHSKNKFEPYINTID